jgi:hypothetical protein
MDIKEALQIVIDLAKSNALELPGTEEAEIREARRQWDAIDTVEDMAVNQFGDN